MIAQRRILFYNERFFNSLTNAITVCKAKDAFDLVKCHMLLDLYHIPVEFRGWTAKKRKKEKCNEHIKKQNTKFCADLG